MRHILRVIEAEDLLRLVVAQTTLVHICRHWHDFLLSKIFEIVGVLCLAHGLVGDRGWTEDLLWQRTGQIHLGLDPRRLLGTGFLTLSHDAELGFPVKRVRFLALSLQ